ncbi:ABC transporter substrate-binding protein [Sphingobium baderi]|uniref:ABC transporter substrate-binding protein n=1 Tax=Sphingobium baderi TaxID=1332080 RepID=UPI002B411AD0|nr:ABC transporter substrate-binding protein [Sphingobium baderi]WRD78573.1 ABC transporter substrate-binding protein [Sphingobium baderi]
MKRLILAGVLALACGASALAQTVKVGIIAPLSGPFSSNGKMWEATVKAYQKIHGTQAGGATVEVVWKDLADINPAQARALAQELIVLERGVPVFHGPVEELRRDGAILDRAIGLEKV